MRKLVFWVSDQGLYVHRRWLEAKEGFLFRENKGAGQLHYYRPADFHLCFSHMQKAGFLMTVLILVLTFLTAEAGGD